MAVPHRRVSIVALRLVSSAGGLCSPWLFRDNRVTTAKRIEHAMSLLYRHNPASDWRTAAVCNRHLRQGASPQIGRSHRESHSGQQQWRKQAKPVVFR